jgi:hypothetical protein
MKNESTSNTAIDPEDAEINVSQIWPESYETVEVDLPAKAMWRLEQISKHRERACDVLLREYIGEGIRRDATRLFSERALLVMEQVLSANLPPDEVERLMAEVTAEFAIPRALWPHRTGRD